MNFLIYSSRIIASVLILSLSMSISVLSLGAIQRDSLSEILQESGIIPEKTEISNTPSIPKKKNLKNKNLPVKTSSPELIRKNNLSSSEVERILETVIQKPEISKNSPPSKEQKIQKKTCVIPAKIPDEIQHQFKEATKDIPCEMLSSLRKVEIFDDPQHIFPRAMANGRILKIRKDAIEEPEFIQVLIHELGHVVDLGGLKSTTFSKKSPYKDGKKIIYADDKSVLFYQISWSNESTIKPEISALDFVGGYAANDMFEDYAESFLLYIKHGNEFRYLAEKNPILKKKYLFFKTHVFFGKEFDTGDNYEIFDQKEQENERPWDITKI